MTDITLPRAELEQWLVALLFVNWSELYKVEGVITALRERLAQPEQEPVIVKAEQPTTADYAKKIESLIAALGAANTAPPQRTLVDLTDEEILHRIDTHIGVPLPKYPLDISDLISFARVIEHESRGKNT